MAMLPRKRRAIGLPKLVIGHPIQAPLAAGAGSQVPKLQAQVQPSLAQVIGINRSVLVGGYVPVVRRSDFNPTDIADVQSWRQPATQPFIIEAKLQPRAGQYGHILKAQHRTLGDTQLLLTIKRDRRRIQHPVWSPIFVIRAWAS